MSRKILVVQNHPDEGLGVFADELKKFEISWDVIMASQGESLPQDISWLEEYRGLMVLGGPMGVGDALQYPFLAQEIELIRTGLKHELPMLNICLGAQLLARACDMPVTVGKEKEIGFYPVYLNEWYTQRNPLFFQSPKEFVAFHWHRDTFDIPIEGYRLIGSDRCPNQAFCIQGNAYGLQFHVEVTKEMIARWTQAELKRATCMITEAEGRKLLSEAEAHLPALHQVAHQIIYGFNTNLRAPGYRRPEPKVAAKEVAKDNS